MIKKLTNRERNLSSGKNKQKPSSFWRAGTLLALIAPLLAACGGGGGGGEAPSVADPSLTTSLDGTGSSTTPVDGASSATTNWTDRLFGQDVPRKMIWNGASYVGVDGENGYQISSDAKVWQITSSLSRARDIAWDGSTYVALASMTFKTSSDGKAWTSHLLPDAVRSTRFNSVAKSASMWVAVGQNGTIIYSTDAANWTVTPTITIDTPNISGFTPELRAVTWTGSQFIVVGESGVVATSPNGISWTVQPSPTSDSLTAIASHGGLIVAATSPYSGSVGVLMTSTDGISWTTRVSPLGLAVNSIVYAGGKWVVAGFYKSMTSIDGEIWTEGPGTIGVLTSVVHNGTEYVATGIDRNSIGAVFASSDGLNWTVRNVTANVTAAARSPDGRMVAVGNTDSSRTSVDGITWDFGHLDSNYPFLDLTWSPKLNSFVGLVQVAANQDIYTSADGKNWQVLGNYAPCGYVGATVIASPTVIVNAGGSLVGPCLATSTDGVTWQTQMPPWTQSTTKGFWTGNQFIVLGTQGLIATSSDGGTWTSRTSGTTSSLYGGTASPSTIVVVGAGGTILTSADNGVSWTSRNSGTSLTLKRAVWTGSGFYVVGNGATLLKSPDGITWTAVTTPYSSWSSSLSSQTPPAFLDAVWSSAGRLVVFGSDGLVGTVP